MTSREDTAGVGEARSAKCIHPMMSSLQAPAAAQRVLDNPKTAEFIVDERELYARLRLPQLNRAYHQNFARPQAWAACTAPSCIEWTRRGVRTERCVTLHKVVDMQAPVAWQDAGARWCLPRAALAAPRRMAYHGPATALYPRPPRQAGALRLLRGPSPVTKEAR